jgi:hypothetical protein
MTIHIGTTRWARRNGAMRALGAGAIARGQGSGSRSRGYNLVSMSDATIAALESIQKLLARIEDRLGSERKRLLTRQAAADSLSMSLDSFEKFVQPHIRLVRQGSMRLVPVEEIDRWIKGNMGFAE